MNNYQVFKRIQAIRKASKKTKPDPNWVASTRSTLLMQVKNSTPEQIKNTTYFKHKYNFFIPRFEFNILINKTLSTIVAIILVIFGGIFYSVSASERSLPGDFLYSVKLAKEQAQLAMEDDSVNKIKLKVSFTEKRVKEIKALVAKKSNKQNVIQATEILKSDLHTIKEQLHTVKEDKKSQSSSIIKEIDGKADNIIKDLEETKKEVSAEEKSKLTEAQAIASDTAIQGIRSLANLHSEDSNHVSRQEVVEEIKQHNQTLQELVSDPLALKDNTLSTSSTDSIVNSSSTSSASSTSSTIVSVASSTIMVNVLSDKQISTTTQKELLQKATNIDESLLQTKKLVDDQKIEQAIDKLDESGKQVCDLKIIIEKLPQNNSDDNIDANSTSTKGKVLNSTTTNDTTSNNTSVAPQDNTSSTQNTSTTINVDNSS